MKTAVFYDLENIGLIIKNGKFEPEIVALRQKIEASDLVGEIALQRAYMRSTNSAIAHIGPVLAKHGIELMPVKPICEDGRKKTNLVDFKMGVDVIATIATKRSIGTVAIASGDNDFGFLCQQIKEMNKKLMVISRLNTTGEAMLALCDDWIDLNERPLSAKFIMQAIEKRIPPADSDMDFFVAFNGFLQGLENDMLIRRYMTSFGLPFPVFEAILRNRRMEIPRYKELGFSNLTAFMEALLSDTNFAPKLGHVKYSGQKPPPSQVRLLENIVRRPTGYSREKLFKYYAVLAEQESVDELLQYIHFMGRNGMLKKNKLCYKRTFRATIRKHLRSVMAKAGVALDEAALAEVEKKL